MSRNGEGQPDVHARRITLHRRVQEFLDLGEGDDLVKLAIDLGLSHSQHGAVQVDVLPPGELGMEPRADFEQRSDPPAQPSDPLGRLDDPAQDFQQR